MAVRCMLHGMGCRYSLHRQNLPGRPVLVFGPRHKVVFFHGCFWHGHDCRKGRLPISSLYLISLSALLLSVFTPRTNGGGYYLEGSSQHKFRCRVVQNMVNSHLRLLLFLDFLVSRLDLVLFISFTKSKL